jgi:hypothetical protein
MLNRIGLIVLLFAGSCTAPVAFISQLQCGASYTADEYEFTKYTNFKLGKMIKTRSGIAVDTSGQMINLEALDSKTAELEKCLGHSIKRCGFKVKLADKSAYYPEISRELFSCNLPGFEKGCEKESPPCGCSGIVQYPNIVVITPNLESYKHELIHLVTGISDHKDPIFNKCQR